MKARLLGTLLGIMAGIGTASAVDNNTVEINFSGTTATVTVASNISAYVTDQSSGSHVKLVQSTDFAGINPTVDNEDGEIIYVLSGSTTDGEFYLEGAFKCTVELKGVSIANPSGPAINIQNGKRVAVSAKNGTTNTLTDGANDTYNGCYHCKGHTKFKGKGTLNVIGNSKHAVYSKEYIEVKNLTMNVTSNAKDAIHCKEYFLMESGNVNIKSAGDDGIQVELDGLASTGITTGHDNEDTGNFYMTGGTLNISNYQGKAIKADGTITFDGGTQGFDTSDTMVSAGIENVKTVARTSVQNGIYDLTGRRLQSLPTSMSICIVVKDGKARKLIVR